MHPSYTVFHRQTETFSVLWTEFDRDYKVFEKAYEADAARYGDSTRFCPKPDCPRTRRRVDAALDVLYFVPFAGGGSGETFAAHLYDGTRGGKGRRPYASAGDSGAPRCLRRVPWSASSDAAAGKASSVRRRVTCGHTGGCVPVAVLRSGRAAAHRPAGKNGDSSDDESPFFSYFWDICASLGCPNGAGCLGAACETTERGTSLSGASRKPVPNGACGFAVYGGFRSKKPFAGVG